MNKKALALAVTLLVLPILIVIPVQAKPSEDKNNDKFVSFVMHLEGGFSTPVEGCPKINPPWAEEGSPDVKVSHTQAVWTLGGTNDYMQIGGDTPIDLDLDELNFYGYLIVQTVYHNPYDPVEQDGFMAMNYRIYETITWDDNFIEMESNEKVFFEQIGPSPYDWNVYGYGTFSGLGEIDGQKVQVMGVRHAGFDMSVMAFVVENTGTLQYLGQAP